MQNGTITTLGAIKHPAHPLSIAAQWSTLAHKSPSMAVFLIALIAVLILAGVALTRKRSS